MKRYEYKIEQKLTHYKRIIEQLQNNALELKVQQRQYRKIDNETLYNFVESTLKVCREALKNN